MVQSVPPALSGGVLSSELFDIIPGLDGVIVSPGTFERQALHRDGHLRLPELREHTPMEWYTKLISSMYEPIQSHGKTLVVRDFLLLEGQSESGDDAVQSVSPKIVAALKTTPHDFYMTFPNNPRIGHVDGIAMELSLIAGTILWLWPFPLRHRRRYAAETYIRPRAWSDWRLVPNRSRVDDRRKAISTAQPAESGRRGLTGQSKQCKISTIFTMRGCRPASSRTCPESLSLLLSHTAGVPHAPSETS